MQIKAHVQFRLAGLAAGIREKLGLISVRASLLIQTQEADRSHSWAENREGKRASYVITVPAGISEQAHNTCTPLCQLIWLKLKLLWLNDWTVGEQLTSNEDREAPSWAAICTLRQVERNERGVGQRISHSTEHDWVRQRTRRTTEQDRVRQENILQKKTESWQSQTARQSTRQQDRARAQDWVREQDGISENKTELENRAILEDSWSKERDWGWLGDKRTRLRGG